MEYNEILKIRDARIKDAKILYQSSRYDGAVYLCGYAIELGLKAKICQTLNWNKYPTGKGYSTFKTHDVEVLLHLSGIEEKIKSELVADWSIVSEWSPESRYKAIGSVKEQDAKEMIESTEELLNQI